MSNVVRNHLLAALKADFVGPFHSSLENEVLTIPPSRWYVTGFLVPVDARQVEEEPEDDEMVAGDDEDDVEASAEEAAPKQRALLPSSVGLSVLLKPGTTSAAIDVELTWADYAYVEIAKAEGRKRAKMGFKRVPHPSVVVKVPLDPKKIRKGIDVPGSSGLRLIGKLETVNGRPPLDDGTRALSLFLINERPIEDASRKQEREEKTAFQVEMTLRYDGIIARPNRTTESARDFDDRVADLQFRERCEYAVGHGVSVDIEESIPSQGNAVSAVRIVWIPTATVKRVVTREDAGEPIEVRMEELAKSANDDQVDLAKLLSPIATAYGKWIAEQRKVPLADSAERRETRDELMDQAERAKRRMEEGIARLERDPEARLAFALANRAMAMQARQTRPDAEPRWRLFQLAFVLQCIEGVVDDQHHDREVVDLIFFPTGGGKTEAYLGVIAFTLLLRRLRGQKRVDKGYGVAVLLRYTLRLLTLDQLARAARLICALELIRREDKERNTEKLGDLRFAIGLWVGKTATANTFAEVKKKIEEYRASVSQNPKSPFPLTKCPWCGRSLDKESFRLVPKDKPTDVVVSCLDRRECPFGEAQSPVGLPVLFVDEQVYAELPCFLLATVDKFAMLPWRGETGLLFGRATARKERCFYGPMVPTPKGSTQLPEGLLPPELIVQDELHLIAGPLGTMCGLYETAIDALASRPVPGGKKGRLRRPKVLASTATVRRAREQVRALFGRSTALFPPPGIDEGETFFARVDHKGDGRLYVGLAATGRPLKQMLIRTYIALLAAAMHEYDPNGDPRQTADGYMSVAGYFNSLRELGGMRRLVDDDVRARLEKIEERMPENFKEVHPWFAKRPLLREPVELTSRETTARIAQSKARLEAPWAGDSRVDVVLASNMISVGVDIDRLGVMVVAGQPKSTSEYIQASSRVGRDTRWPGIVVTAFNMAKPRDRSHYERFRTYHESFYRFVEAQSLTPFSGPALDRGLAGTLVAMTRLGDLTMTAPEKVADLQTHRPFAEQCVEAIAQRAGGFRDGMSKDEHDLLVDTLRSRGKAILDAWQTIAAGVQQGHGGRSYSKYDKDKSHGKSMLSTPEDKPTPDERLFLAPTSMRDVEPTVHLWVERRYLGART